MKKRVERKSKKRQSKKILLSHITRERGRALLLPNGYKYPVIVQIKNEVYLGYVDLMEDMKTKVFIVLNRVQKYPGDGPISRDYGSRIPFGDFDSQITMSFYKNKNGYDDKND